MLCEEMTPRQGCFVGWHTIVKFGLTYHNLIVGPNGLRQSLHLEKTPGYAEQNPRNFAFGPHDVLVLISTSGIREVIVEMAKGGKWRGLTVIGVVSREHCERARPAQPGGKKLLRPGRRDPGQRRPRRGLHPDAGGRRAKDGSVQHSGRRAGHEYASLRGGAALAPAGIQPVFLPSHQFAGNTSVEQAAGVFLCPVRRPGGAALRSPGRAGTVLASLTTTRLLQRRKQPATHLQRRRLVSRWQLRVKRQAGRCAAGLAVRRPALPRPLVRGH